MDNVENVIVSNNVPGLPVHIFYSGDASETGSKKSTATHYHEEIELLFVIKGKKRVVADGISYDAGEGDVIFVNSGVPHTLHSAEEPLSTLLVQFNEKDFTESEAMQIIGFTSKLKSLSEPAVVIIRNEELFSSGLAILKELEDKGTAYDTFIKAEIYKILGFLYKEKCLVTPDSVKASRDAERVLPILSYINKNYGEEITLKKVSSILGFDQSYFCRVFKRATGLSFVEYLNFVRVSNAEKLLTRTNKRILEISEAVGFSSVSYFNRIFKKYKNCSPRYYQSVKHGENM